MLKISLIYGELKLDNNFHLGKARNASVELAKKYYFSDKLISNWLSTKDN